MIVLLYYYTTILLYYYTTMLPCYYTTMLPCYYVTMPPCYFVTMPPCYFVTMPPCYFVTMPPCYLATMLLCYLATMLLCYLVTLLPSEKKSVAFLPRSKKTPTHILLYILHSLLLGYVCASGGCLPLSWLCRIFKTVKGKKKCAIFTNSTLYLKCFYNYEISYTNLLQTQI